MTIKSFLRNLFLSVLIFACNFNLQADDATPTPAAAEKNLSIIRITPSGEDVPASREITFQFNRAVVPVGRMERSQEEVGIAIEPKLECQWRWLNTTTLACQLGDKTKMLAATRYQIKVSPKIKSGDGFSLAAELTQTFITARPKATYVWHNKWESPTQPQFFVSFDQPVDKNSIADHVFLLDESGKRHAVTVEMPERSNNERWLVSAKNDLPADTAMRLVVEPGVRSTVGSELGVQNKDLIEFATFGAFKFLGVSCYPNLKDRVEKSVFNESYYDEEEDREDGKFPIQILVGDTFDPSKLCNPTSSVSLLYSTPVIKEDIQTGLQATPDLTGGRKDFDPWEDVYSYAQTNAAHRKGEQYTLALPTPLRANQTYQLKAAINSIKDIFGRGNEQAVDLSFLSDHRPAKFHLGNQVSILEKDADSQLPLIITNLDKVVLKYDKLTSDGYSPNQKKIYSVYDAKDIAYAFPLGIRDLLSGKSGLVQGIINAKSDNIKGSSWFFSEVTPFQVHAKIGHYNSLVWVTRFSDGKPVPNAKVSFYQGQLNVLSSSEALGKTALTDKDGIAYLDGTSLIDPDLKLVNNWERGKPSIFARVESNGDIAVLPASNDFSAYSDSIYPYMRQHYGHMKVWGTTAQGVYKLGDTMQYKILVRDQDLDGFIAAPQQSYSVKVSDPTGKIVAERNDVKLSEFGAIDGEIEISKTWPVGWYDFQVRASFTNQNWSALRVLVSDFTPASFHVTTNVKPTKLSIGDKVDIESEARLHAGGPFSDAKVRVTANASTRAFNFADPKFEAYEFGIGDSNESQLYQVEGKLDSQGNYATSFTLEESSIVHGIVLFESAVTDDRGKSVASTKTVEYFGRERFVGLKQSDWILQKGKNASIQIVVVDKDGKLLPNVPVELVVNYEETKAAKVKGPGNAYVTEYTSEWIEDTTCNVQSAALAQTCSFTPKKSGRYKFVAKIKDSADREHVTELERWAGGDGYVLWNTDTGNSLNIIPEKNSYSIGDTAKYLVQNPFPGATALISVERYGVIKSWMQILDKSAEIIEVPVTAADLPGFYLSVVVVSQRVDKPIENQVDLGKPAFRIGYAKTEVIDNLKELQVNVKPERLQYKPRDTVTVDFEVINKEKQKPTELAVAVLDESVFDLIASGMDYFDPFKGLYSLDSLDVRNFNIIKQLVGRQKFEKKGANPGGSGGADLDMRSIFKFVSYWNPSVKVDAEGKAKVSFQVPDNLTGWRVLALATTKTDQMGLGDGNFKVNQALEIRPALPNQVLEGDSFSAAFTVMNRTDKTRTVDVTLQADGAIAAPASVTQKLTLAPFKREKVNLTLIATKSGEIEISARAQDADDSDGIKTKLVVNKKAALETAATYGSTVEANTSEKFSFPENMRDDIGSVGIVLSPTVIGGIEDSFKYLKEYPYSCWEQKLTKGVMADHYKWLKDYLPKTFSWTDASQLVLQTIKEAESFQTPSGGMAFYIPEDRYASPYLSAYTDLAFNWLKARGQTIPESVEKKLDDYLLNLLRKNAMPEFYSKGMSATVRAVALAALAPKKKITIQDLERYLPHVSDMDLFGKAHFLLAASLVEGTAAMQKQVVDAIMATSNETGGKFIFSEDLDGIWQRVMASIPRSQCAILSALLSSKKALGSNLNITEDTFFKIVRSISQYRKIDGRWENTQENIFCMNALIDFSQTFEKFKPNYSFEVLFDKESMGKGRMLDVRTEALELERKIRAGDPGKSADLEIEKSGSGRLYYQASLTYSPKELKTTAVNSGIEVKREYNVERSGKWELLKSPFKIKSGELVRVDLFVSLPAVRNFVVVNDPIPGGLESVNRDLATASTVDADKGNFERSRASFWFNHDNWIAFGFMFSSFYHQELRHDSARFYSEYLPAGNYVLSYTAQAIAPGKFTVLPTHAEEMYDPDVFGQGVPDELVVEAGN